MRSAAGGDWSAPPVSTRSSTSPSRWIEVLSTGWFRRLQCSFLAVEAVEPLAAAFATAPVPIATNQVMYGVRERTGCGS